MLDYYRSRLCSSCPEMPSMPSLWRSEARTTYATTYCHITLAILYMRDKHYWEDSPTTSNGHEFILIVIDYFTKWVETVSYKVLNSKKVDQFIQTDIIYRYGVLVKLSLTIDCISREKQKSCCDSSTFSTINLHLTILRLME